MDEILRCPICNSILSKTGPTLNIINIFNEWKTIHSFSEIVIEDHSNMAAQTTLFQCPSCFFEVYLPQVIGSKSFYEELQNDTAASYYRDDKWDFVEALKEVRQCHEIIEIGCGPGSFLMKAKTDRACGTEYNESALQVAREKGLEVYGLDVDLSGFKNKFDAVFSFHVLEHVADPIQFINEIAQFVKPGGMVCISVPNQAGPLKYITNAVMNMPPHHATHWQLKTFKALAKKMNFRLSRVAYEPLLVENYNYYSFYWVNGVFNKQTKIQKIGRVILPFLFTSFFELLIKMKIKYFPLLRGQAIYVVFEK